MHAPSTPTSPYAVVGAGPVTSTLWKRGEPRGGFTYRLNLFRMAPLTGRVTTLLRPEDLPHLVRLCGVLAAELAGDGCLPPDVRARLARLADAVDEISQRV